MAVSSYRVRIFLTCWIIFALHFATDFVREHYLVLSIGDNFSFQLTGYEGLHHDIFTTEEHGTHHGANPGASMIAVLPYLVFKPLIDAIDRRVQARRAAAGEDLDAAYEDPRPNRVRFFKAVRERGLDIKFGLTGLVTQVFCMAPLSVLSAVLMLWFDHGFGLFVVGPILALALLAPVVAMDYRYSLFDGDRSAVIHSCRHGIDSHPALAIISAARAGDCRVLGDCHGTQSLWRGAVADACLPGRLPVTLAGDPVAHGR
jgi:hypothetical protein